MTEYSKLVTTTKGKNLIVKAATGTYDIKFTKVCTSNAIYTEKQLENLTGINNIRQTGIISKISRADSKIKVETVLSNTNLTDGYYMRTIGLYANDPEEGEILYAACVATNDNCYMPANSGISSTGVYINMYQTVDNAPNISLEVDSGVYATIGDIQELTQLLKEHTESVNNPHNVTKEQVGLGNVDDTSDLEKPLSVAVLEALNTYYAQLTAYTDKAISDLINGAPTTLDTLKELADAIQENKNVQEALDAAIGSKANQKEFDTHIATTASKTVFGHVKVDDELSATSTNPVQNMVITKAISNVDNISDAEKNVMSSLFTRTQYINSGNADFNDYKAAGIYYFGTGCTINNIPIGSNGWLIVIPNSTGGINIIKQIFFRHGTFNETMQNDYHTFIRTSVGNNRWSNWTRLMTEKDVGKWKIMDIVPVTLTSGGSVSAGSSVNVSVQFQIVNEATNFFPVLLDSVWCTATNVSVTDSEDPQAPSGYKQLNAMLVNVSPASHNLIAHYYILQCK